MNGTSAGKILRILNKYGAVFLLWLLCAVSISAALYIYTDSVINLYTAAGSAAAAGLIWLFGKLRKKKFGGSLYFGILIALCVIVPSLFIGRSWQDRFAFIRWFFSGAQAEETRVSFMLTFTPLIVFFLTSALYYFTRIIYRSSMLTLVSLIPFALAVKAAVQLPYAYAATAASIDLVFFIADGHKKFLAGSSSEGTAGSALTVYTDFALAAVMLALLVPKPSVTPYYDKFDAMVSMFSFGGSGETEYQGEYKETSGQTDEFLKSESVLLYIMSSSEPTYMKTQVFNEYDSAAGLWNGYSEISGSKDWEEDAQLMDLEKLVSAAGTVIGKNSADAEEYSYGEEDILLNRYPWAEKLIGLADGGAFRDRQQYSVVYAQNFPAVYLPAPLRTMDISISERGVMWTARSDEGEVFTNMPLLSPNVSYTVRYYSENTQKSLIKSGLCNISADDWHDFLFDLWLESEAGSEESAVLDRFFAESISASAYRESFDTEISPELKALAEELTAGLEYDCQKAQAIENFFTDGSFLYDLSFEPPEDSDTPEYFVFESRTGICSDFARAYVLLARAAGLTARYAEGFVPQPSADTAGTYFIYSDNAHAYPEVYIPMAGWTRFEPTPSNYLGRGGNRTSEDGATDYTAAALTAAVFIAGFGVFILLILFSPKIAEGIFRARAKHAGCGKGVIMLYNRHVRNAENSFKESCRAFTPEQMERIADEKTGQSLEPLTKPFTQVCYGGKEIGRETFEGAYECYKTQAKAMRKLGKKRKKFPQKINKTEG
ncbi:MAG: transglutaminase domain-containing protein [Prevotella sp.]|nr:transglutaminase domain-containing protein [Prevotella sp.]